MNLLLSRHRSGVATEPSNYLTVPSRPLEQKDASQIVPLHSSDPMMEGPLCQIRREARACRTVEVLELDHLDALDFNRPNRDARLLRPLCERCSIAGMTSCRAAV